MDTINYNLLHKIEIDQGAEQEIKRFIIINETYHPTEGHLDEYVELFSDDTQLEMMAKLACTEIITQSSKRWPGFDLSETKCLYIMPGGDEWMRQMTRWADDFPMTSRLDPDPCGLNQFKSALFK